MLALVLVMLLCVAAGAGVVVYVMIEARQEGRGEFWTAEGEELIAGARRTSEKVRERSTTLSRTAVERTQQLRERLPERRAGAHTRAADEPAHRGDAEGPDLRAAG